MKRSHHLRPAGTSLVETILAVAVLAVAIPLVFGALAESGRSGMAAKAETRSTWMVSACLQELTSSRTGNAQFLPPSAPGETIPPTEDVWALAFAGDGRPLGRLAKSDYERGSAEMGGQRIHYIARLSESTSPGDAAMLATISIEFPATAPSVRRRKLDFHTHLP